MGGSPSHDKVCGSKEVTRVTESNALYSMEDSDIEIDEDEIIENYGTLPEHEKRIIDLMRAASGGNVDAQRILYAMGFARDDG